MASMRYMRVVAILLWINTDCFTEASRCPGAEWFGRPGTSSCYYIYARSSAGAATGPYTNLVKFDHAFEECRLRGGKLFVPSDMAELEYVIKKIKGLTDFYWIGLTYENGRWQWTDESGNPTKDFTPDQFPKMNLHPPQGGNQAEYRGAVIYKYQNDTFDFEYLHKNASTGFVCSGTFSDRPWCRTEEGWVYDDNKCYLYVAELHTYPEAQANCRSKGGFVSAINTPREDQRMREWMRNRLGMRQAWLGVTISNKTNSISANDVKFDDGESIQNNMVNHWDLGFGKTLDEYIRNLADGPTYCGEVYSSPEEIILIFTFADQHDWSLRSNCESRYPYACEVLKDKCPYGWEELGDDCYQFNDDAVNWSEARRRCAVERGDIVPIKTQQIQDFVRRNIASRLPANPIKDNVPNYWIGGSKKSYEPNFMWTDGSKLSYSSWSRGQPVITGATDYCAFIDGARTDTDTGNWHASFCWEKMGYVCAADLTCGPPFKRYHDGCYYYVTERKNRDAAQEYCDKLPEKSYLITPFSAGENSYVAREQIDEGIWLGIKASSLNQNGRCIYKYADGNIVDEYSAYLGYDSFARPPLSEDDRLCTILVRRNSDCADCEWIDHGKWAYVKCTDERSFMCYHDGKPKVPDTTLVPSFDPQCGAGWTRKGDSCYKTHGDYLATTWRAAKQICQNYDPHSDLLSILTKEEDFYIRDVIVPADYIGPLPPGFARAHSYWINFYSNRLGFWFWPKRDSKDQYAIPAVVFNWGPRQPDNSHNDVFSDPFFSPISDSNPRCAYVVESPDAVWADDTCGINRAFICKKPTVLARPLTGPPPTPPSGYGCLPGYSLAGSKCIQLTSDRMTWRAALTSCRASGGDLLSFDSPSKYQAVFPFTNGSWIGLSSLDNPRLPRVFGWSDNSTVQYIPWDTNNNSQANISGTGIRDFNCVAGGINGLDVCSCEDLKPAVCATFIRELPSTQQTAVTVPHQDALVLHTGDSSTMSTEKSTDTPTETLSVTATVADVTTIASPTTMPLCIEPPQSIVIYCSRGNLSISDTDYDLSDALTAEMFSDYSFKCRNILRNMHKWLLRQPYKLSDHESADVIHAKCSSQTGLTISDAEPEVTEAVGLVYSTGINTACRSVFLKFLKALTKYA